MISGITIIIIIFILLICAGILYFFFFYLESKKTKIPPNMPIVFSNVPQFTDGFKVFLELDSKPCSNGNYLVTLIPRDVYLDWLRKGKPTREPKIYKIVVGREKRKMKGDFTGRLIIEYLPDKITEIPQQIRDSDYGKILELGLQQTRMKEHEKYYLDLTDEKITEMLGKFPDNATELAIAKAEDIISRAKEIVAGEKKEEIKKRPFGFGTPMPI